LDQGALLWVGGEDGMEGEIISRLEIPYKTIPAAGIHGVGITQLPANLWRLFRGYLAARGIMREFEPDVLFFTGGYLAVPAALAGRKIPSLVFVPDIEPGLAIRTIARLGATIALSVLDSKSYLRTKKPIRISGYPVRADLLSWTRDDALEALDLSSSLPVLLVFGGSKGARSINQALIRILPDLLDEMQVVHITGKLDWSEVAKNQKQLSQVHQDRYRVYPFLHEKMGAAFKAADLVVSRSGASILGEYPLFSLPAILVPYPYAWRYQKTNANYLVEKGAAEIIEDEKLNDQLLSRVIGLINNPEKLDEMKTALRKLAQPDAARVIAEELLDLGTKQPGGQTQ
jgi:UDP-N-acetylglucosamine--N-acetylmuramyl-(pentapeptide) pyrophosphoryl-undecaprenol N-acetylglucosamine transferase